MATVSVNGIVKTSSNERVISLWEEYFYEIKLEQRQGKRKWTIWFTKPHGLNDGDWLDLTGDLSTKSVEWTAPDGTVKHLVDHIINAPEIRMHDARGAAKIEKPRDLDDEAKYAPF